MEWFIKAFIRVGLPLLPRLFGHPLYSPRLGALHWYLANVGLGGLVVGFLLGPSSWIACGQPSLRQHLSTSTQP
jgi:hypothetical protein